MKAFIAISLAVLATPFGCFCQNDTIIRTDYWLANQPEIFMGFLLVVTGIVTFLFFLSYRKSSELHLLYLAIFILGYGLRIIAENELVLTAVNLPRPFWTYISAFATDILPIFFILFLMSFSGPGWKGSVWWLLAAWIAYGLTAITAGIITGIPEIIGGGAINKIMVILIIAVLSFNRFMEKTKHSKENGVIEVGIIVFIASVLYNNLVPEGVFISGDVVELYAFLFFLFCMIGASIRHSMHAEREYQAILHDLETARQIQLSILPGFMPASPSFGIFPAYIPTAVIGGDFYAVHHADDKHLGVLVADISGHGIPAALLASMIKVAFNSNISVADRPAMMLESMNHALTGQLNNEFITAAYLWMNFDDMMLCHASAGHPAPILIRGLKAEDLLIATKNIPIGIAENVKYGDTVVKIFPGDRIVIYTDGLVEVFNARGEVFGKSRLLTLLEESVDLAGEKIPELLIREVNAWSGKRTTESLDDDVTVIVVDIRNQ
jgi:sigma-B regulation protein RsbU (phosphoserine phosphatase)